MSQLKTIFEKIKENLYENHLNREERDKYKLIFSPFSTGFTYDDFLFLDSNAANENALKYLDELLEFSQIANTIPRENDYWVLSDQQDYLFNLYNNILSGLRLMDIENLSVDKLYGHQLFQLALNTVNEDLKMVYEPFFKTRSKLLNEIKNLDNSLSQADQASVINKVEMLENKISQLEERWLLEGKKEETEEKIIAIFKDEFKRFMSKFVEIKGRMETMLRSHPGSGSNFYLTSCTPNNLYKGNEINWKKITMDKTEVQRLMKKINDTRYDVIMADSDLSELEVESISFELLYVNVTRAWFDESILCSPFWDINVINTEIIDIPRVTSKLVFLRNVAVGLNQNSYKNKTLLEKGISNNLGPFILKRGKIGENDGFQLNSVNKSLKLDRKIVFKVGAKLNRNKRTRDLKSEIGLKQHQFTELATRLKPTPGRNRRTPPRVAISRNLKFRLHFKDKDNGSNLAINGDDVQLLDEEKRTQPTIQLKQEDKGTLLINLNPQNESSLIVMVKGYKPVYLSIELQDKKIGLVSDRTVWLEKEKVQNHEEFQLIGVISKEIEPFPNPIKGVDYL
ncbi:hypothetical protein [Flagellimonas beolgyonensis]|uniref:hypothetical protein n=2 Tax=Flavobacteriaceae TaxID=49546 RepID=UPI003D6549AD